MHEQSLFTDILNRYFGDLATQVLHAVHVQPYNPQAPITETFAMEILVLGLLLIFFVLVRISLNVENPGTIQQIAEMLHGFVSDQADSIIGHGAPTLCHVHDMRADVRAALEPAGPGSGPDCANLEWRPFRSGVALLCFFYYHYYGFASRASRLSQAIPGADLVDLLDDAAD